jgi:glutathione S-transferase
MEDWADQTIGINSRKAIFAAISQDQNFRKSLLPISTPDVFRNMVEFVPSDFLRALGFGVGFSPEVVKGAIASLKQDLDLLTQLLRDSPYLLGDTPTLADFAVAGLSMLLKFPPAPYLNLPSALAGKGLPIFSENPDYQPFFSWRDRLYTDFRTPLTGTSPVNADRPTPISIQ